MKKSEGLSLRNFCKSCNSKCCKDVEGIGSPILDRKERDRYEKFLVGSTKEVVLGKEKKYYLLNCTKDKHCIFLDKDGSCKVQDIKPMDCLCYPIKAVYEGEEIIFLIDSKCPASNHLSKLFVDNSKKVAITSIKRFDKDVFNHWLKNYIGWVNSGKRLIE